MLKRIKFIRKLLVAILLLLCLGLAHDALAASDLIGVRIYSNKKHLSPSQWYLENVSYPGSPQLRQIDGYEAVVDGRTTYVAATNQDGGTYYTNIYLISYNEQADEQTIEIYSRIIDNWYFNTNISDQVVKDKIVRDTKRLADLQAISSAIEEYGQDHRYCNISTNIQCTSNDQCPENQICLNPQYPELSSGSYVQGQSTSKWPSWQQTLAPLLGSEMQVDPVNEFTGCLTSPELPDSGYSPETCWNEVEDEFKCITGSKFYYYSTVNPNNYELAALNETIFSTNLNDYSTLNSHINIEGMIGGDLMCQSVGLGAFCGNGILNYPPEECELGDTRNYCDLTCGDQDWHMDRVTGCQSDCSWFDPYGVAPGSCSPGSTPEIWTGFCGGYCGDNELQGIWEECDTSQFPGGWSCIGSAALECDSNCELECSDGNPPYQGQCGNNILEYPETCEAGYQTPVPQVSGPSNQYVCSNCSLSGGWCGDGTCQVTYGENINLCPLDCPPAPPGSFSANVDPTNPMSAIILNWSDTTDEDGYRIWRSMQNGIFPDSPSFDLPAGTTSYTDDNLATGTHYYYKLAAYTNAGGESSTVYANEITADSYCGDFIISGSELCDDGLPGTIGPIGQPGHNGQFGFCNASCNGIEGLGIPLFYDNFENWSNTQADWQIGYNDSVSWSQYYHNTIGSNVLEVDVGSSSNLFPRDFRVIDTSVASITDVDVLAMVDFSAAGLTDHDAVIFARHNGAMPNSSNYSSQRYYALWNDYGQTNAKIQIKRIQAGSITNVLAESTPPLTNGNYWLHFQVKNVSGNVELKAKWWTVGSLMPSTWNLEAVDDNENFKITVPGKVGLAGWVDTTFYYDNFMVYDPNVTYGDATAFVTSDYFDGDLITEAQVNYGYLGEDGLGAADHICQSFAVNSPNARTGIWRAWVSQSNIQGDNVSSASNRLSDVGEYKLVNGSIVASGLVDLRDGALAQAIKIDENGNNLSNNLVWTASDVSGNYSAGNCDNWSSYSSSLSGKNGDKSQINTSWTNDGNTNCNNNARLYCLYQGTNTLWPDTPGTLVASQGPSGINLNWVDNSSDETGFEIFRSTDGLNFGTSPLATVGSNTTSYADNNVTSGNAYYYKVRAKKFNGVTNFYSYFSNKDSEIAGSSATGNIFITSLTYNGDLNGLAGADSQCQTLADSSAWLEAGTYKAILSSHPSTNAADRITHSGDIIDVYDNIVASSYSDLITNGPDMAVEFDENRDSHAGDYVWTGSDEYGQLDLDCNSWQSYGSSPFGSRGESVGFSTNWIFESSVKACGSLYHLYCLRED